MAASLADGVRAGQSMAALLGYQIERGLHDGYPGLELDRFIALLRDRFPLLSGRLAEVPPSTSADVIEARNVVDGLSLVEAAGSQPYPYGVNGLPAPQSSEAAAIRNEIRRLGDALDAVSDLLTSESVHQAVQGNLARTQAAQQALTSPVPPPEPEIIRTPRSGRVLTFRVTLALDAGAVTGWSTTLSPRAGANPQLNHWLSQHLPAPGDIQWTITAGATAPHVASLDGLGLEPIDLVLMSGDRIGDRIQRAGAIPDPSRPMDAGHSRRSDHRRATGSRHRRSGERGGLRLFDSVSREDEPWISSAAAHAIAAPDHAVAPRSRRRLAARGRRVAGGAGRSDRAAPRARRSWSTSRI